MLVNLLVNVDTARVLSTIQSNKALPAPRNARRFDCEDFLFRTFPALDFIIFIEYLQFNSNDYKSRGLLVSRRGMFRCRGNVHKFRLCWKVFRQIIRPASEITKLPNYKIKQCSVCNLMRTEHCRTERTAKVPVSLSVGPSICLFRQISIFLTSDFPFNAM